MLPKVIVVSPMTPVIVLASPLGDNVNESTGGIHYLMSQETIHGRESFRVMPEHELVCLAHEGDRTATQYLIDQYRPFVLNKARSFFVAGADQDDVMQEGMIGLLKAIRDFRADRRTAFRPFAEVCVTRQIVSAVKAATRNKHAILTSSISLEAEIGDSRGTTLQDQIADPNPVGPEDLAGIEAAIAGLSELENDVMRCFLEGKTYGEISIELQQNVKAIDNALQRVRKKVCNSLEI